MSLFIRQHLNQARGTLSYLLVDAVTRSAALIDAFDDQVKTYCRQATGLNVNIRYLLYTRHFDATANSWQQLKARTGASLLMPGSGEQQSGVFYLGETVVNRVSTPGYSPSARVFQVDNLVFTGLTLLAGGLPAATPSSDAAQWYHAVHEFLYKLPDDYLVYPGQLHACQRVSCIAQEKACNQLVTDDSDPQSFYQRLNAYKPSPLSAH